MDMDTNMKKIERDLRWEMAVMNNTKERERERNNSVTMRET